MFETGPNGIKFISGGSGLIDILNVEKNSMFQLINSINPLEKYTDKLVVDIPAGASEQSMTFASAVDKLVIVLVGEPTSFMDAYTFIKSANLDYDIQNFSVVVNMVDNEESAQRIFTKFQNAVIKFFDANLTFAGGIPRSKKVQNAIMKKTPVVLDKEAELEKLAFQRVAKNIIKTGENKHNGIRFFTKS